MAAFYDCLGRVWETSRVRVAGYPRTIPGESSVAKAAVGKASTVLCEWVSGVGATVVVVVDVVVTGDDGDH